MAKDSVFVTSFYKFVPLTADVMQGLRIGVTQLMEETGMLGLVLVAPEGVNGTVAGSESAVDGFREFFRRELCTDDLRFKDSRCDFMPFHRLSVEVREEIVGMKRPDLVPATDVNSHLSPAEWHAMMASPDPKVIIDTRNKFETTVGKFKGAIDPGMTKFSDWTQYLDDNELPKDIPVMIYCTGGIRCEKAILELQGRGHTNVVQLRDGILGYLEEFPDGFYEGECFVFDDRVAVDSHLAASERFGICPGCGLTSDDKRSCQVCGSSYVVCEGCRDSWEPVCSKTCRDLWARHGESAAGRRPKA